MKPLSRFRQVTLIAALVSLYIVPIAAAPEDDEPIAYIGHGAFFDRQGRQIKLDQEFVAKAQDYYRAKILGAMAPEESTKFKAIEQATPQSTFSSRQNELVVKNRSLGSLATTATGPVAARVKSIVNALDVALKQQLPARQTDPAPTRRFSPDPPVRDLLEKQALLSLKAQPFTATVSRGQQYIDECRSNGVPIPPPVGKLDPKGIAGWKSLGFIPQGTQFIVGSPAELRVYSSTNPSGMCFALPRYTNETKQTVDLDGVICLGRDTSKVCFWDNQMPVDDGSGGTAGVGFQFETGEQIPIGVPDLAIDPKGRFQAGGFDLVNGTGGICTDCHSGENPFIVHPKADLGGGLLMGKLNRPPLNLPVFSMSRYDPFVPSSWPQNENSERADKVPPACSVCHAKDEVGGRFPLLSSAVRPGYCGTILQSAIEKNMPPANPGGLKDDPDVKAFLALCSSQPDLASADPTP